MNVSRKSIVSLYLKFHRDRIPKGLLIERPRIEPARSAPEEALDIRARGAHLGVLKKHCIVVHGADVFPLHTVLLIPRE